MPHKFTTAGGSEVLPTNGGPYYTGEMSADWPRGQVYLEFFSDAAGTIPVTPSAGEVITEGAPMGNMYLAAGNVSSILAASVGGSPMYEPPSFDGCVIRGRLAFYGVVGAPYARAIFWRS
jgi:hypothetical protein